MSRKYTHIKQYEKEMFELKEQGITLRQIGETFGLTYNQVHDFFKHYNRKQRKLLSGEMLRTRKERSELPPSIQKSSKLMQLQYILAGKERHIKRLEMENELMRDFLSLTGRN